MAFSLLYGGGTGGEGARWGKPTLPTGCWQVLLPHAPPHATQIDGEITASKIKENTGFGRLLPQNLICGSHQMTMNMPETQSILQQLLPSRKTKNGCRF